MLCHSQLQRLHHPHHVRAVIAMGFSPDGERLVTVGADNNHSLFVWRWLTDPAKRNYVMERKVDPDLLFHWPRSISGTGFGPTKKIEGMTKDETGFFYKYANTVRIPLPPVSRLSLRGRRTELRQRCRNVVMNGCASVARSDFPMLWSRDRCARI